VRDLQEMIIACLLALADCLHILYVHTHVSEREMLPLSFGAFAARLIACTVYNVCMILAQCMHGGAEE
jgi:accessory gene regulator protein AgrB